MKTKLTAPGKRSASADEIINVVTDATRIRLMKLSLESVERIKGRMGDLTYNILDVLQRLSVESRNILSFALPEWEAYHGLPFIHEQKQAMEVKLWGERTLDSPCPFHSGKMVRETHGMIMAPDNTTIMKLHEFYPAHGTPRFYKYGREAWYREEAFARLVSISLGWHLVLIEMPLRFSEPLTYDEQVRSLPKEYKVAPAALEALKNLIVSEVTGKYPNPDLYANTSDRIETSDPVLGNKRIRVGSIPGEGVSIDFGPEYPGMRNGWRVGLAVERKPELPLPGNLAFEFSPL